MLVPSLFSISLHIMAAFLSLLFMQSSSETCRAKHEMLGCNFRRSLYVLSSPTNIPQPVRWRKFSVVKDAFEDIKIATTGTVSYFSAAPGKHS